jgi:UDP-glucose 4-epimerase
MEKILITGGAGYIGAHMVHYLLKKGYSQEQIIVFDNLEYGHKKHLLDKTIFIKGDLRNRKDIEHAFEEHTINAVIHFAAYAYVGESMNKPHKYFHNNCTGGLNLLNAMKENNCKRIIFSSTCATYGIPKKIPISETEQQKPINPYGESKLMFEKMLKWFDHAYNIKSVSLRYFNVGGAGFNIGEKHDPETHLIPLIIEAAQGKRDSIRIFGDDYDTKDGTCIRDYIHVIDLCDAHLKALQFLEENSRSDFFNLGTSEGSSVKEVIKTVKEVTGKDFKIIIDKRRDGDPAKLVADFTKAKEHLSWMPQHSLRDIISSAWKWHNKSTITKKSGAGHRI